MTVEELIRWLKEYAPPSYVITVDNGHKYFELDAVNLYTDHEERELVIAE